VNGEEPAGQTKNKIVKKGQSLNGNDGWRFRGANDHVGQSYDIAEVTNADPGTGSNW
jgi:hypothetical protein